MRISRNCFDNILPICFILIIVLTSGIMKGLNILIFNKGFALMGIFTVCVLYIGIFYILYSYIIRGNINIVKPILPIMFLYIILIIFGIYGSINKLDTAIGMIYLISLTIFISVIIDYYEEKTIYEMITKGIVIVVVMNLIFIIIFPQYSFDSVDRRFTSSLTGMFYHKNSLGSFMGIANIVMLINLVDKSNITTNRKKYILTYIITFVFVIMSNSTTSLLIMLGCSVLVLAYKLFKFRMNIIVWLVGFHVALYTVILQSKLLNDIMLQLLGRDLTLTGRVDIWKILLTLIKERPMLGYGYNSIWNTPEMVYYINSNFSFEFLGSHNGPIHLILEFGIIGFLIFFIIFLLMPSIKLKNLDLKKNKLHMFIYTFYAYILIYSVSESTFSPDSFQTVFLILSVVCIMNNNKLGRQI